MTSTRSSSTIRAASLESLDLQKGTVRVSFRYKDYAHGGKPSSMTLGLSEFLRRFILHILPPRFVKIRHYGLLFNRDRPARIAQVRDLIVQCQPQSQAVAPSPPPNTSDNVGKARVPVVIVFGLLLRGRA